MHRMLERQLRRHLGVAGDVPEALHSFVAAVDAAYDKYDRDHALLTHTLDELSRELTERNDLLRIERDEQAALARRLEELHTQLLHAEKMASLGQLAAGVAHEINNPIGFVNSNLSMLGRYVSDLLALLAAHRAVASALPPAHHEELEALHQRLEVDFLTGDLPAMLAETQAGIDRVRKIVQDLKDFSHADEGAFGWADIRAGLDSTLNLVAAEIRDKADVVREYGDPPMIECLPAQLNQVFMNLLINAAQALPGERRGTITLRTGITSCEAVWVEVADNGSGIPAENLTRIFDPFFTTKPVGQGTGLGLSLSYGIIRKHHGRIEVESTPGVGSTFRIHLPVRQPQPRVA